MQMNEKLNTLKFYWADYLDHDSCFLTKIQNCQCDYYYQRVPFHCNLYFCHICRMNGIMRGFAAKGKSGEKHCENKVLVMVIVRIRRMEKRGKGVIYWNEIS